MKASRALTRTPIVLGLATVLALSSSALLGASKSVPLVLAGTWTFNERLSEDLTKKIRRALQSQNASPAAASGGGKGGGRGGGGSAGGRGDGGGRGGGERPDGGRHRAGAVDTGPFRDQIALLADGNSELAVATQPSAFTITYSNGTARHIRPGEKPAPSEWQPGADESARVKGDGRLVVSTKSDWGTIKETFRVLGDKLLITTTLKGKEGLPTVTFRRQYDSKPIP